MDRNPTEQNRLLAAYRAQTRAFIRYIRWARKQRAAGVVFEAPDVGELTDQMMVAMMRSEFERHYRAAQETERNRRMGRAA